MKERARGMIAMSGGVDSSVAALLLRREGYDCLGVNLRLYRNTDLGLACHKSCCSQEDADDAASVAFQLGMDFETLDYSNLFRLRVMGPFVQAYLRGLTPNPCLECNRHMKFDLLLHTALDRGFDVLATGHYARVGRDPASGRWQLRKARDLNKDQSYVLYMLTQDQLAHLRLPLGDYEKPQVRQLAREEGLVTARKGESQDICFIPDGDYGAFLERWIGCDLPEGPILDQQGSVLGRHRGAARYTIGQRRGLDLPMGEKVYVIGKDMERNAVTIGPESALYRSRVLVEGVNWLSVPEPANAFRAGAKLRYRQAEQPCTVEPLDGHRLCLLFDEPQRAPTPGQAAVVYQGDLVLCGGRICKEERPSPPQGRGDGI